MLELAFSIGVILLVVYSINRDEKRGRTEAENRRLIERLFFGHSGRIPRDIFDQYSTILITRRISDLKHIYRKEQIWSLYDNINRSIGDYLSSHGLIDASYVYVEPEPIIETISIIINEEVHLFRIEARKGGLNTK